MKLLTAACCSADGTDLGRACMRSKISTTHNRQVYKAKLGRASRNYEKNHTVLRLWVGGTDSASSNVITGSGAGSTYVPGQVMSGSVGQYMLSLTATCGDLGLEVFCGVLVDVCRLVAEDLTA